MNNYHKLASKLNARNNSKQITELAWHRLALFTAACFLWTSLLPVTAQVAPTHFQKASTYPSSTTRSRTTGRKTWQEPISHKSHRSGLPNLAAFVKSRSGQGLHALISKVSTTPQSAFDNVRLSLLDENGRLVHPVAPVQIDAWKKEIKSTKLHAERSAALHLWLGEWQLAQNEQPHTALMHFEQVEKLALPGSLCRKVAAYENAVALMHEGAYQQAAESFHSLLTLKNSVAYDRFACALWYRHASACAAYHSDRARLGIPEPPYLDPQCGVAALAACLKPLALPYDRKSLLSSCRVTGEGSNLKDLVDGGKKLGATVRPIAADDQALMTLPKPLIAHVERDHFVALIRADEHGVSYLCSDCGAWPGGRVNLTWMQWHAINPDVYAVVTRPGSDWDRALARAIGPSAPAPEALLQVASAGKLANLHASTLLLHLGNLLFPKKHFILMPSQTWVYGTCGLYSYYVPIALHSGPAAHHPCDGDPVNLATGEEEYSAAPDLFVYNPHGPSVAWGRLYNSLVGSTVYENADFGLGWSQRYNAGVLDPQGSPSTNPRMLVLPNHSQVAFTPPVIPSASQPVVSCSVQPGVAMLINWCYDPSDPSGYGYYTITFPDRTQWTTGRLNSGINWCPLAQITDRNSNSIYFNYGSVASRAGWPLLASITDKPSGLGNILLTVQRATDGTGSIVSVSDIYGRAVYYHVGAYHGQELDFVSQVVPNCTPNPPAHYVYGWQAVAGPQQSSNVYPYLLHTVSVPSPTGGGISTRTINYDPNTLFVSSYVDANGNAHNYTSVDVTGATASPSNFTNVAIANPQGHAVYSYTVGFDSNMNTTTTTDGSGTVVSTLTFSDPNDPFRPSSQMDGNGRTWSYTWDQYGNPTSIKSPRGAVVTNTWSYSSFALGELTQTQQANGSTVQSPAKFTYYEPSGLLNTAVSPLPGTTGGSTTVTSSYTYDSLGNVLTATGPGNNAASTITTTFGYSQDGTYTQAPAIGQPLTVTDNLGKSTHLRYDLQGNLLSKTDALGNETDVIYDIANHLLTVTLPMTGQTGSGRATSTAAFLYPDGPLMGVTAYDESNIQTRQIAYSYGQEGELLSVSGSAKPASTTYDALYRPQTISDGDGHSTQYAYNAAGYLASMAYPSGDSVQFPQYDADGNVLKRIDGHGVETDYIYNDPENALTDVQYPAATSLNVHYGYDGFGRQSGRSDGAGTTLFAYDDDDETTGVQTTYTGLPAKTISYGYYPDGSRQTMTTPAGAFSYQYDADGQLAQMTNPYSEASKWTYLDNGWLWGQQAANGLATAYTYNARGFLTDLTNKAGTSTLSEFGSMVYDGVGNRTSVTASVSSAAAYGGVTAYKYDSKNQLTQEQSTQNGGYTNAFAYDQAENPTTLRGTGPASFNLDNQNTATGNGYDGEGNPTTYKGSAFSFDTEDRLTSIGTTLAAGYTGEDQRAWKQNSAGTRTYFLYDGTDPVCEMDASGNVLAVNTFGANGLLSRRSGTGTSFYAFDAQGNPSQTLTATAAVQSTSLFDAYGNGTNPSADPFSGFGSQWGYYRDSETGLQLLGHRYYDSGTGRFINRDPAGYAGGINLYAYAGNNPINAIDPSGLDPQPDFWINASSVSASFGNTVTFGLMDRYYEWAGLNGTFDRCSGWYKGGEVAGMIVQTLATDGAGGEANLAHVEEDAQEISSLEKVCTGDGCFVAGTPLTQADGSSQAIDQAPVGSLVSSRSDHADRITSSSLLTIRQTEPEHIERRTVRTVPAVVTVALGDTVTGPQRDAVTATPEHPLFVLGRGWMGIERLTVGDALATRAGPPLVVQSVTRQHRAQGYLVYNLTVEGDHTYFVGKANGGIWAHNVLCAPTGSADDTLRKVATDIDSRHPGAVKGWGEDHMYNGEQVDIELDNALIEVKRGNGSGLAKQIKARVDPSVNPNGLPVIGYASRMGHARDSIKAAGGIAAGPGNWEDVLNMLAP